jgi:hypothetical protein
MAKSRTRICACGTSYVSAHATSCLKCMMAAAATSPPPTDQRKRGSASPIAALPSNAAPKGKKSKRPPPPPPSRRLMGFARPPEGTVCVLCGEFIPKGQLLQHKAERHRERVISPSPAQPHKDSWVRVHQGGLPSLGKRSR